MKRSMFQSKSFDRNLYLLVSAFLFIYVSIRAAFGPIVHDEAETFFIYIQSGSFLPPDSYLVANNHLLNSFLTFLSWKTFGTSLWALRLPNLLSLILFLIYVFKIGDFLQNRFDKWAFYIGMLFTHYIIEFFGYTRGYGLSMAFNLASIYHLILFIKSISFKDVFLTTLYSVLALSANLGLMITFVLIHSILILNNITRFVATKDIGFIKKLLLQAIIGLPPFIYLLYYTFLLKSVGSLEIGSSANFFNATLVTLSNMLFKPEPKLFTYIASLVLMLSFIVFILVVSKKNNRNWACLKRLVFPLIFFGNLIFSVVLSYLMGINYPEDRTALYLVPLFIASIIFLADVEALKNHWIRYIFFLPVLLSVLHFALIANINFSSYTPNYRIPSEYYKLIREETTKRDIPPVVETYKEHRTEWYFTNLVCGAKLSPLAHQIFPSHSYEYVISDEIDFPNWRDHYQSILYNEESKKHLFKRTNKIELMLLDSSVVSMEEEGNSMFLNLFQLKDTSFSYENIQFVVDLKLESPEVPFQTAIIAKANTPDQPSARMSAVELERIKAHWNSENNNYKFSLALPQIPSDTEEILIFIFNKKEVPFKIIEAKTWVYAYN